MRRLTNVEQRVTLLLGCAGALCLTWLHRLWTGQPGTAWVWAGLAVCIGLFLAGALRRRGPAAAAALLTAAAPWDFWYPVALPFLVLAVVLLARNHRAVV